MLKWEAYLPTGMDVMGEGPAVPPGASESAEDVAQQCNAQFPSHWEGKDLKVAIYNRDSSQCPKSRVAEAAKVVHDMFPHGREPLGDYLLNPDKLFDDVIGMSNYEVKCISRVQNEKRWAMAVHFNKVYGLKMEDCIGVYHGCTEESAQNICSFGFRGGAGVRFMHGKGTYSAKNVWGALAYSKPHPMTGEQMVVVARLAAGPKKVGSAFLVDFGSNAAGDEILTTTNKSETIYCAKYDDQLFATYEIRLKYREDIPHTEEHHKFVKIWHEDIFKKHIRPQCLLMGAHGVGAPGVGAPGVGAPGVGAGPNFLNESDGLKLGDAVVLRKPCYAQFAFAKHQLGKIAKIIVTQFGSPHQKTRFMIHMDDRTLDSQIMGAYLPPISATQWVDQGGNTVIAAILQGIKKVDPASGAASRLAGFAASQMAAAGTSVQQAVVVTWEPTWKDKHTRKIPKPSVHFQVGDRVCISKSKGMGIFNRCVNKRGTIKAIFKGGYGGNVHFCIELDDFFESIHIKMNCRKQAWKFPGQEENTNSKFQGQGHDTATWLVVTSGFVEKLDAAVGEKRKADGNP